LKYSREFTRKVKDGKLIYNSRPFLPVPVKINSLLVHTHCLPGTGTYPFEILDLGQAVAQGEIANSQILTFSPPLKIGFGNHDFNIKIRNLHDYKEITATITINYSFANLLYN